MKAIANTLDNVDPEQANNKQNKAEMETEVKEMGSEPKKDGETFESNSITDKQMELNKVKKSVDQAEPLNTADVSNPKVTSKRQR